MSESRESRMVTLRRNPDGTPSVWCDPEIADLVSALNAGGVPTVASCSGHGERPGNIALADGRELIIAKDYAEARAIEAALGLRVRTVPEGMVLAYGYLWHAGNPSEVRGDNLVLPPEIAAAKARLELRGLLTTDQRCRAIDKVRAMLAAAQQQKGSGNG